MELAGVDLCPSCSADVVALARPFCEVCALPVEGRAGPLFVCPNCAGRRFAFRFAVAAVRGRGVAREMIHGLKYGASPHLAAPLARILEGVLDDARLAHRRDAVVVPVPLHRGRLRKRGYNQAALIARRFARAAGVAYDDSLRRTRATETQTRLDRDARRRNLDGAFDVRRPGAVAGRPVWLVDDVLTTGSTAHACAETLISAGAGSVIALAVARA